MDSEEYGPVLACACEHAVCSVLFEAYVLSFAGICWGIVLDRVASCFLFLSSIYLAVFFDERFIFFEG